MIHLENLFKITRKVIHVQGNHWLQIDAQHHALPFQKETIYVQGFGNKFPPNLYVHSPGCFFSTG